MEFGGVEVKAGESVKASLGEIKKEEPNEPVVVYLKVGEQKFVLGTLSWEKILQTSLNLVLEKEFELSHSSKHASVHFCGYKCSGDDEEGEFMGKPEKKVEKVKAVGSKRPDAKAGAAAKRVKVVESEKDNEDSAFGSSDETMDDAESDEEFESDEESDRDEEVMKIPLLKGGLRDS